MQNSFGQHLKNLLQVQTTLPANSHLRAFIDQIVNTVGDVLHSVQPIPQNEGYSGASSNKSFIMQANVAYLDAAFEQAKIQFPQDAQKLAEIQAYVAALDTRIQIQKSPVVQKATTAAIKGIQLNTRGEFAQVTKDIEDTAMGFVERFGVKPIWARNLVGMFTSEVDLKDRAKFLKLCYQGKALNIDDMVRKGHGSLEDVVATSEPTIQKIFKSIKETLLDISLSTGQRGATGPFEAMLAIMGGARKPDSDEGGDLKIAVNGQDKKFEVKAGSITVKINSTAKNGPTATGSESAAWLDSTSGQEVSGDYLRGVANDFVNKNFPTLTGREQTLWGHSDFRSTKLGNLNTFLSVIEKKKPGSASRLVSYMMSEVFPTAPTAPGFNFKQSIKNILAGIGSGDAKSIAKEQGTMALIEYALGKGNDGFILFNSSTQEYKILMDMKGIMDIYNQKVNDTDPASWEKSIVRFLEPMTMSRGKAKCSPSIYFGPLGKSKRAKEYAASYMNDPDRVQRRLEVERAGDPEFEDNYGFESNATPTPVAVNQPRARRSVSTPRARR